MDKKDKIIILDDEESIRFSLEKILSSFGYEVKTVSNLTDARELILKNDFDVAIVDRILSDGEDGIEFLKDLKSGLPFCQAIMISAYPSYQSAAKTLEYNTIAYLSKPFEKDQFFQTVSRAVNRCKEIKQSHRINMVFDSLFNTLSTPIVVWNCTGDIIFINPGFTIVFGYTAHQLKENPFAFMPDWDVDKLKSDCEKLVAGETVPDQTAACLSIDGSPIDVKVGLSLCKDAEGNSCNILMMLHDTRQDKEIERHLIQESRMEAVAVLSSGMAHDFNNLLQIITGNIELFLDGKDENDPGFFESTRAYDAAQKGQKLIKRLLEIGRQEKDNEISSLNINLIIEKLQDILMETLLKKIPMELSLAKDLKLVMVDSGHMEQVILNLCMNARDAILEKNNNPKRDSGNTVCEKPLIKIETRNLSPEAISQAYPGIKPAEYILISVSDTGCGISKELRSRIFEPYFTTKGAQNGNGLGLFMVYTLIKKYNGEIIVKQQNDHGTIITILLPVSKEQETTKTD